MQKLALHYNPALGNYSIPKSLAEDGEVANLKLISHPALQMCFCINVQMAPKITLEIPIFGVAIHLYKLQSTLVALSSYHGTDWTSIDGGGGELT
ncbi:hypothetical protein MKZ38_010566 [Zalerion maritima]|uniref:Uncharacterized protein n=1 Tax=Zalerion maritima TaxID=339359 RepID=A0AAD5RT05_9PEZI|nr:hypothetical protein MKZ38_010566 [Zalerion maritima]